MKLDDIDISSVKAYDQRVSDADMRLGERIAETFKGRLYNDLITMDIQRHLDSDGNRRDLKYFIISREKLVQSYLKQGTDEAYSEALTIAATYPKILVVPNGIPLKDLKIDETGAYDESAPIKYALQVRYQRQLMESTPPEEVSFCDISSPKNCLRAITKAATDLWPF